MRRSDESFFCAFSPAQFVLLATVLGLLIARGIDDSEQESLGNFLATMGQVLQTAASQSEFLETDCKTNSKALDKINELKQQIWDLENELKGR
ncbi:MAG: hypothetical protein GX279_03270 [Clostridiaceae bacterium]|jgi:hypothetical protein|nr:hypothetical protein [Clostridiaceae bacterium]